MSFNFDLGGFEQLMLIYITYTATYWGVEALIRFFK